MEIIKFEEKELISIVTNINPYKADRDQYPSFIKIKKNAGEAQTVKVIITILSYLKDQLNINKTLTGEQMINIAESIIHRWYWLNPADLKICFTNAINGDYGIIYDRLDMSVINEWLTKYEQERVYNIEHNRKNYETVKLSDETRSMLRKTIDMMDSKMKQLTEKRNFQSVHDFCEQKGINYQKIDSLLQKKYSDKIQIVGPENFYNYISNKVLMRLNNTGTINTESELINLIQIV